MRAFAEINLSNSRSAFNDLQAKARAARDGPEPFRCKYTVTAGVRLPAVPKLPEAAGLGAAPIRSTGRKPTVRVQSATPLKRG
jgi:hypothetical protein